MSERTINWQVMLPRVVFLASALALATAYVAEFAFGLKPCNLCLWQRVPYFVSGGLGLAALAMAPGSLRSGAMALAGVSFLAGAGVALHHVGVEQHWWGSVASCGGELPLSMSANDLRAALSAPPDPACDAPTWVMLGVSAAIWNMLLSLGLAALTAVGLRNIMRAS